MHMVLIVGRKGIWYIFDSKFDNELINLNQYYTKHKIRDVIINSK